MVIGRAVPSAWLNLPGPSRGAGLAVRVIPMGWLSAVGICQYLPRRLLLLAQLPPHLELRKDRALPAGASGRVTQFYQAYIDTFGAADMAH